MTHILFRLTLAVAGLFACCSVFLAEDTLPLRFDLIPREHTGKNGQYLPTRGKVSIPDVPRDRVICFWRPKAFRVGPHTIRVGTGDGQWREFKGTEASFEKPDTVLEANF